MQFSQFDRLLLIRRHCLRTGHPGMRLSFGVQPGPHQVVRESQLLHPLGKLPAVPAGCLRDRLPRVIKPGPVGEEDQIGSVPDREGKMRGGDLLGVFDERKGNAGIFCRPQQANQGINVPKQVNSGVVFHRRRIRWAEVEDVLAKRGRGPVGVPAYEGQFLR